MRFLGLAADYDGTLAHDGIVATSTVTALERLKQSGRRLILVTGRELTDLGRVFPPLDLFDLIVAENGALLFAPRAKEEIPLAPRPPAALVEKLRQLGVAPLSVGRSIIATWEPNETVVLRAIGELGLKQRIVFNKGAVMVLPPNIDKASGLDAALDRLNLSAHRVVGVGDAENDHAFLMRCGCAVAVANALPALKAEVDLVTERRNGAGVVELIGRMIETDLSGVGIKRLRPIS